MRPKLVDIGWVVFALANLGAMILWPSWETIPFHFIWVSLTLVYGFRVWRPGPTVAALVFVWATTGTLILIDIKQGEQLSGELSEVPLMSAMFLAMVWHAKRRLRAQEAAAQLAEDRAELLGTQERFVDDASHELRTPVTIARGHLEILAREGQAAPEVGVALDELGRIERIVERLLLLAKAGQDDFLEPEEIELESFLEDVFMRWSEIADRSWRLGTLPAGTVRADRESLRIAVDALLENAVKYTERRDAIELSAEAWGATVEIAVSDEGAGIPPDALNRIFERFGRADVARTRERGGVGLGLAIVDAIARAHGGRCSVRTAASGSTFGLRLPGFRTARLPWEERQPAATAG